MKLKQILLASCLLAAVVGTAQASPNLLSNSDFSQPSSFGGTIAITTTDPAQLGGQAAAAHWSVWAGQGGGRVITTRTPTGEADGGYMLDVLVMSGGDGLVQAFLPPGTGPSHIYACVSVRLISGRIGMGVGNGGDTHSAVFLDQPGDWQLLGTENGVTPANEIIVYRASDSNAEFQIRAANVSEQPIPCGHPNKFVRPETLYKPEPPPWTLHPAKRGGDVQPVDGGAPAQSASPNAHGFYDNMAPGGVAHDDSEHGGHEPTHPVGGGGKKNETPDAVQLQQPPQPAVQQ